MAVRASGALPFSEIQTEFGGAAPISLNEYYRGGSYVPNGPAANAGIATAGAISMNSFYGSVREFAFTISANVTNANIRSLAVSAGWDGSSPVRVTIASGVWLSGSFGTAAATISGSFPNGVTLVNNGYIAGSGGAGGYGGNVVYDPATTAFSPAYDATAGAVGYTALIVSIAATVYNYGVIAGGGGGGGGGASHVVCGGGGGGGGQSGQSNSIGGGGGNNYEYGGSYNGASGGAGTTASAGAGGAGGAGASPGAVGGSGGAWGASGASGANTGVASGAGGAAAGNAVSGNSYITWGATGTRYGALS